MLISFELENWMSFKEKSAISMVASRERQHRARVSRVEKHRINILPISAFYGGNASGKTALFKAIAFVQRMVVHGTRYNKNILVKPFRLDESYANRDTSFRIEILVNENIYEYYFRLTRHRISFERLTKIGTKNEKVMYERNEKKIQFARDFSKEEDRLQLIFQGTRKNQLFLTNSVDQNLDYFEEVYNWFKSTLVLISPDTEYGPAFQFIDDEYPLSSKMKASLSKLDTGIVELGSERFALDNLPKEIFRDLEESIDDDTTATLRNLPAKERVFVNREEEELVAQKLISYHEDDAGNLVKFDLEQESDGTLRLIDLLPAVIDLVDPGEQKVYIIDEIDRSLHTLMVKYLLRSYLDTCSPESRSQLLFTTHDVMIMDQNLLRRDEMWVLERDQTGCSLMWALSDFKEIRNDKDIRKSYLQGRLGGVPRFLLNVGSICDTSK